MKLQSVEGYLLAYSFIESDKSYLENKTIAQIHKMQQTILSKYSKNISFQKLINKMSKKFIPLANTEPEIETIVFAVHLIIKNPTINKFKGLKMLALEVNRDYLFSRDEVHKKTKEIVNKFYAMKDKYANK